MNNWSLKSNMLTCQNHSHESLPREDALVQFSFVIDFKDLSSKDEFGPAAADCSFRLKSYSVFPIVKDSEDNQLLESALTNNIT